MPCGDCLRWSLLPAGGRRPWSSQQRDGGKAGREASNYAFVLSNNLILIEESGILAGSWAPGVLAGENKAGSWPLSWLGLQVNR